MKTHAHIWTLRFPLRWQGWRNISAFYTEEQKAEFVDYMNDGLINIQGDMDEIRSIFFGIYANSVKNTLKST